MARELWVEEGAIVDSDGNRLDASALHDNGTYAPITEPVALAEVTRATAAEATKASLTNDGLESLLTVKANALRPWWAALANRRTAACNVVVVGDSIVEGQNTTTIENRWVSLLRDLLRSRYGVTGGGIGYVPAFYAITAPVSAGFTTSGTVTQGTTQGLGKRNLILGSGATMTLARTATQFKIFYTNPVNGTQFKWAVDGGAETTVTTSGGASVGNIVTISGLSVASHSLVITQVSGAPVIEGVMVYNGDETTGLRLWESGHYGYTTNDFSADTTWTQSINSTVGMDLCIIALGTNDFSGGVSLANFKTRLKAIITALRLRRGQCTYLLLAMPERGGGPYSAAWTGTTSYVQTMYDIATEDVGGAGGASGVAVLDLTKRMLTDVNDVNSLIDSGDHTHPTDKGYAFIADRVLAYLAAV